MTRRSSSADEMPRLQAFADRWSTLAQSRTVQRIGAWARIGVTIALVIFLAERLHQIGWQSVLASLPTAPAFYAFLIAGYMILPLCEWLIFRRLWLLPPRALPVFFRKRVYNEAVIDHAGDAFLLSWANLHTNMAPRTLLIGVKDAAIISAAVSHVATILLAAVAFQTDFLGLLLPAAADQRLAFVFGVALLLAMLLILVALRRKLLHSPAAIIRHIAALHTMRLLLVMACDVAMWESAVPAISWSGWLIVLAGQFLLTRMPFLPNKDLSFAALGVGLAGLLHEDAAALSGMFVAGALLTMTLNILVFTATHGVVRRAPVAASKHPSGTDE